MLDWLLLPIDPSRGHLVDWSVAWHGRLMVLAWGVITPLTILIARFLKVMPGQDWPRELDNQVWWRCHWIGQTLAVLMTVAGLALVLTELQLTGWHRVLGYTVISLALVQVLLGIARGSKGGPTAPAADGSWHGDHYNMTQWRLMFESVHKSMGYLLLAIAVSTVLTGLWHANAPRWMWIVLPAWWFVLLAIAVHWQRSGWALDTYQAIWGPDQDHPGNRMASRGWGVRRVLQVAGHQAPPADHHGQESKAGHGKTAKHAGSSELAE